MADTLAVDIRASLAWLFQDQLDLSTVADASRLEYNASLADGNGAGEADKLWHDERTLAAESSETLDLTALPGTLFGSSVATAFGAIKALLLVNLATADDAELVVGGAATHPWYAPFNAGGAQLRVPADSCLLLVNKQAGWLVLDGSVDRLLVDNPSEHAVTYRIVLVGTQPD